MSTVQTAKVGLQRVRYGGRPVTAITVSLQFSVSTGWIITHAEDDDGQCVDLDRDEQASAVRRAAETAR